jgi:hypothetical protein
MFDETFALRAAIALQLSVRERISGIPETRTGGGKITSLPGQSAAEDFSTLAHELAHELLHRDNRRGPFTTSRRIREAEAEATAFVVCHAVCLETGSEACDYLQLWRGDAPTFATALRRSSRRSPAMAAHGLRRYVRNSVFWRTTTVVYKDCRFH